MSRHYPPLSLAALRERVWDAAGPGRLSPSAQVAVHAAFGVLLQDPAWEGAYAHWRLRPVAGAVHLLHYPDPNPNSDKAWVRVPELPEPLGRGVPKALSPAVHRQAQDLVRTVFADPAWSGVWQSPNADALLAAATPWLAGTAPAPAPCRSPVFVSDVLDAPRFSHEVSALLGNPGGMLKPQGLFYHSAPVWSDHSPDAFRRWVVATTGRNVVGVAGLFEREHDVALGYVTVAPAFRGQGHAQALVASGLAHAARERKLWVRTQPGQMAEDHPEITAAFDRQVLASPVPHVYSGSFAHHALVQARSRLGVDRWWEAAKPWTDERLRQKRATQCPPWLADTQDAEATWAWVKEHEGDSTPVASGRLRRGPRR